MIKSIIPYIFITIFSLFAVKDLLMPGFYQSHDGEYHLVRIYQFHLSAASGQIPVRWAPTLLHGLGYPLFVVNYTLPYYLAEIFYLLGFGLYGSFKAVIVLTFVVSAFFMYKFLRHHFSYWPSFAGAMLFSFAPYRFANIYARGAIGESVAIAFIPCVFWSITLFHKKNHLQGAICLAISLSLLILSHPMVFAVSIPVCLVYFFFIVREEWKNWKWGAVGMLIAVALSSFQILPALFERHYLQFDERLLSYFRGHFLSFFEVFRTPLPGVHLGTPFQVGWIHTVIIIVVCLLLIKKREAFPLIFLVSFILSISLTLVITLPIWEGPFFFPYLLYPWRFLSIAAFSVSVLGAWLTHKLKGPGVFIGLILVVGCIIAARHYNRIVWPINYSEEVYHSDQGTGTTENEFMPKGIKEEVIEHANPPVEIISGVGTIERLRRQSNEWDIDINIKEPAKVKLGLLAFPGWQIAIDGVPTLLDSQDQRYTGLITFLTPPGMHRVRVFFNETPLRHLGNTISTISLILLLLLIIYSRYQENKT